MHRTLGKRRYGRASTLMLMVGVLFVAGCEAPPRPVGMIRADGNSAFAAGRYAEARDYYSQVIDRRPQSARGHHDLGRTLLRLNRPFAASEHLAIAFSLEPDNTDYLTDYAEALYEADRYDALWTLLRQRASSPGEVEDHMRMADFADRMGKPDEAIEALRKAAEVDRGQTVEPQLRLAEFHRRVGDDRAEVERLRAVIYLEPRNEHARSRLRELGYVPGPSFATVPPEAGGE